MPKRTKSSGCWLWRRGCPAASFTCPRQPADPARLFGEHPPHAAPARAGGPHTAALGGQPQPGHKYGRQAAMNTAGRDGLLEYAGGSPSSRLTLFAVINASPAIALSHPFRSASPRPAPQTRRPATPALHHSTTPFFSNQGVFGTERGPAVLRRAATSRAFFSGLSFPPECGYVIAEDRL